MIPKIIHYCWFGGNPKPKLALTCIKSWKKKCPDYKIIEWNDDNFDITSCPLYVRQAYEMGKWAFVTDFVRLKVVHDYGGIYLDTDVELIKNIDILLNHKAYFGFEDNKYIATGLGFGAEKGHPILNALMEDYNNIPFIRDDGSLDEEACPVRNTRVLLKHGLIQDGSNQELDGDIAIYHREYMSPVNYWAHTSYFSKNTISIHWYSASWMDKQEQDIRKQRIKETLSLRNRAKPLIEYTIHIPNRALRAMLGNEKYERIKQMIKK